MRRNGGGVDSFSFIPWHFYILLLSFTTLIDFLSFEKANAKATTVPTVDRTFREGNERWGRWRKNKDTEQHESGREMDVGER